MNEIEIFNNSEFGEIRTTVINDEPWFVLKDVCKAFGECNYRRVSARLDADEKGVSQLETRGGRQQVTIINESGVYSALFAMQPQKARGVSAEYITNRLNRLHKFRHWVTSEVLPSIRKHGAYMTEQTINKALTSPDFLIQLATRLKEEQEKRAKLEQEQADRQL